jgi:hypothetical protein
LLVGNHGLHGGGDELTVLRPGILFQVIFSALDQLFLDPLDVREPQKLSGFLRCHVHFDADFHRMLPTFLSM